MIKRKKPADEFEALLKDAQPKGRGRKPRPRPTTLKDLKLPVKQPVALMPAVAEMDEATVLRTENEALKEKVACLEAEVREYEALNPTIADVLGKTTTSDLILALVPKILGAVQGLTGSVQSMNSHLESIDKRLSQPPPSGKREVVKKKVAVIGLLSRQIPDLQRQIEHLPCEFRFYETEGPAHVGPDFDHIVVWTNFVNHTTTDRYKGDKRLVLSKGGLKNLADDIRRTVFAKA